jgi:hypothetical protein
MEVSQQGVVFHNSSLNAIASIHQVLSAQERSLSDQLSARVAEHSIERANFSLYADYLLHNEVSHANSIELAKRSQTQAQEAQQVDTLVHPLQCHWVQHVFLGFKEESSLFYGSLWIPVMLVVTFQGCLHVLDLSPTHGNPSKHTGILGAYHNYAIYSSKQCFDDDLLKPIDPTLLPSKGAGIGHQLAENHLFSQLAQMVTWVDIETSRKEVLDK